MDLIQSFNKLTSDPSGIQVHRNKMLDQKSRYTTAVVINGHVLPKGMGVSIKEAKRDAAYRAMGLLTNRTFLAKLLRPSPSPEVSTLL